MPPPVSKGSGPHTMSDRNPRSAGPRHASGSPSSGSSSSASDRVSVASAIPTPTSAARHTAGRSPRSQATTSVNATIGPYRVSASSAPSTAIISG